MRLRLDSHWLGFDRATLRPDPVAVTTGRWYTVELTFDCDKQVYAARVDGRLVHEACLPRENRDRRANRFPHRSFPGLGLACHYRPGRRQTERTRHRGPAGGGRAYDCLLYWIDDLETR